MLVSQSTLNHDLEEVFILNCGYFYFFTDFIISEINEGVKFDWETAKEVINLAIQHYGDERSVGYISNRIHSYALAPHDWLKFFEARHSISAYAIVDYKKRHSNTVLERLFFSSKIKKFEHLTDAVEWVCSNTILKKEKNLMT